MGFHGAVVQGLFGGLANDFGAGASTKARGALMRIFSMAVAAFLLVVGLAFGQQEKQPAASTATATSEPSTPEAIKQFNDEQVAAVSKLIAGKEDQPSEAVFKNIKILTGVPAGKLLMIMQFGYSRSLGTSCAHCHVTGEWAKDDKAPKRITRDMANMTHTIVFDQLRNIDGIKDRNPVINCTTCHRGQLKPALNMDAEGGKK